MPQIAYAVVASLPDERTASEYLNWLRGHMEEVLAAGAESGVIVRSEEPPLQVEARYTFADRAAYERYLREGATRLRAAGLARFPAERGIRFDRRVGTIQTPD